MNENDIDTTEIPEANNALIRKVAIVGGAVTGLILAGAWTYLRNRTDEIVVAEETVIEIDPVTDTTE